MKKRQRRLKSGLYLNGINLSGLKGKRIFGDIHTPSENYLGTPVINRLDEAGKDSRIAKIDVQTGEYKYLPVPKFLDFYDVDYADVATQEIPQDSKLKLYSVTNAPSKEAAKELSVKMGGWLHQHSTYSEDKIIESSDLEEFNKDKDDFIKTSVVDYAKDAKVSKGTLAKLKRVMKIQEEEKVAV